MLFAVLGIDIRDHAVGFAGVGQIAPRVFRQRDLFILPLVQRPKLSTQGLFRHRFLRRPELVERLLLALHPLFGVLPDARADLVAVFLLPILFFAVRRIPAKENPRAIDRLPSPRGNLRGPHPRFKPGPPGFILFGVIYRFQDFCNDIDREDGRVAVDQPGLETFPLRGRAVQRALHGIGRLFCRLAVLVFQRPRQPGQQVFRRQPAVRHELVQFGGGHAHGLRSHAKRAGQALAKLAAQLLGLHLALAHHLAKGDERAVDIVRGELKCRPRIAHGPENRIKIPGQAGALAGGKKAPGRFRRLDKPEPHTVGLLIYRLELRRRARAEHGPVGLLQPLHGDLRVQTRLGRIQRRRAQGHESQLARQNGRGQRAGRAGCIPHAGPEPRHLRGGKIRIPRQRPEGVLARDVPHARNKLPHAFRRAVDLNARIPERVADPRNVRKADRASGPAERCGRSRPGPEFRINGGQIGRGLPRALRRHPYRKLRRCHAFLQEICAGFARSRRNAGLRPVPRKGHDAP